MTQLVRNQTKSLANDKDRSKVIHGRWLSRLVFAVITMFTLSASAVVWAETKSFELSGFDGISAAEEIHVKITKGDAFQIIVESKDPEQLERLELKVRSGILRTRMEAELFSANLEEKELVTIRVIMPSLILAKATKGAIITADAMRGTDSKLMADGGSLLEINEIEGGSMSVDVSNGAHIKTADGTCTSLSADISDGSSLKMKKVECVKVEIDASSGSEASVYAEEAIDADSSTGSIVYVYGAHKLVRISVRTGGEVELP